MFDANKKPLAAQRFSLNKRKWNYRGEGNANLVLALPQEKKILRLKKSECFDWDEICEGEAQRIWREFDFFRIVMVPLLSEYYVQTPSVVRIDRNELKELNEILSPLRPIHRKKKCLHNNYAVTLPDYSLLPQNITTYSDEPTFCIEIKPKQGWIPIDDRRLSKCTFCLNQYLKLANGSISRVTKYCPLDLFSGKKERLKFAVKSLISNPQNNFKIFQDGELVYHDGSTLGCLNEILSKCFGNSADLQRLIEKLCEFISEILTYDLVSYKIEKENEAKKNYLNERNIIKETVIDNIDNNKIDKYKKLNYLDKYNNYDLSKLNKFNKFNKSTINKSSLQYYDYKSDIRHNSSLNTSNDANIWNKYNKDIVLNLGTPQHLLSEAKTLLPGPPCNYSHENLSKNCILNRLLNVQKLNQVGMEEVYKLYKSLPAANDDYAYVEELQESPGVVKNPLFLHLVATSANDCSVMIAFQKQSSRIANEHNWITIDGDHFIFNIGVFDLDLKPLSCIEKHRLRDFKVVATCVDILKSKSKNSKT